MHAPSLTLLAAALLGGVWTGCSCGKAAPAADGAWDAPRIDQSLDRGVDRGGERGVDGPSGDAYLPGGCGGSRTLQPTVIPPGTPRPCGPACKQVTWGTVAAHRYEVADDLLVYTSLRGGTGSTVYYVDLANQKEYRLKSDWAEPYDGCDLVGTDGRRLATTCIREKHDSPAWVRSVTLYDPKTHVEEDLVCLQRSLAADSCVPDFISLTDKGVALDISLGRCSQFSAYFLPLGSTTLENLAGTTGGVGWVHGQGTRVAWSQWMAGYGYQIIVYDLLTGQKKHVAPHKGDQWTPRLQGDQLVWVDNRNDPTGSRLDPKNSDIYRCDLSTGVVSPVNTHPSRQEWPDVYGEWVVWHDFRAETGGKIDIYAQNTTTNEEHRITDLPEPQLYPRVDRGRIFYQMRDINQHVAIFMVDLAAFLAAKGTPAP